jgi:hypothetical protein
VRSRCSSIQTWVNEPVIASYAGTFVVEFTLAILGWGGFLSFFSRGADGTPERNRVSLAAGLERVGIL